MEQTQVIIILPSQTGYRTLLQTMRRYLEKNPAYDLRVIDNLTLPRQQYLDMITHGKAFEENESRRSFVLACHFDLIVGFHRWAGRSSVGLLFDKSVILAPGLKKTDYRKLTEQEYDHLNRTRLEVKKRVEAMSQDELVQTGIKYAMMHGEFRNIDPAEFKKKYGMDLTVETIGAYIRKKYSEGYVKAYFGAQLVTRWIESTPEISLLRYNEYIHAKKIFVMSKIKFNDTHWENFPELKKKTQVIQPFLELPKNLSNPSLKLKRKRLLYIVRDEFNEQGELSALLLLEKLPKSYTLDLLGTTPVKFQQGAHSAGYADLFEGLKDRIRFHKGISTQALHELFHNTMFAVKFSFQGTNSVGNCEALSFGCPVITAKGSMDKDLLIHLKNGYLCEFNRITPKDISSIKKLFSTLQANPKQYHAMSLAAIRATKRMNADVVVPKLLKSLA